MNDEPPTPHPRMNRINLICLGVADVARSRAFYRDGLGLDTPSDDPRPGLAFFDNGGSKLKLFPLEELAWDIDAENPPGLTDSRSAFNGITLSYQARTKDEVDELFGRIEQIGGTIAKHPEPTAWGGYSGYFRDLDGYYWEVTYGDCWGFDSSDMLIIE